MQLTLEKHDKFQQLDQAKNSLSQQVRLLSALLLFQSGHLSRGAACENNSSRVGDRVAADKALILRVQVPSHQLLDSDA